MSQLWAFLVFLMCIVRSEVISKKNQVIVLFILFLIYSEIVKIWAHWGNKRFRTEKKMLLLSCV